MVVGRGGFEIYLSVAQNIALVMLLPLALAPGRTPLLSPRHRVAPEAEGRYLWRLGGDSGADCGQRFL